MILLVKANTVTLSENVDARFRTCISIRHPQTRGARKVSGNEAVTMWCEWVEAVRAGPAALKAWAEKWTTKVKA